MKEVCLCAISQNFSNFGKCRRPFFFNGSVGHVRYLNAIIYTIYLHHFLRFRIAGQDEFYLVAPLLYIGSHKN